jgi:aryl-alcohol dehydrogenase-like predicted oxidoreductase
MHMRTRNLGNTGLKVSELCLGAMTFGEADDKSFMHQVSADEPTSFRMIDRSLDAGVNFIDTADVYGQDGLSERVIGNWFETSGRRNDVVIATKFRFTMGTGPNASGASRYRIVKTVEDSLRRLKTDRIDLYQIHMQDITTPEEETLRALDDLIRAGKVLYIGCSNYAAYRLTDSLWISEVKRFAKFATLQAEYSLVVRDLEREHLPLCRKFGLGILPWSPLAGGFLTGKYSKEEKPPAGSRLERWTQRWGRVDNERCWRTLDAVREIAKEVESTPSAVSLAWLLAQDNVSSVIFGARDVAQVEANIKASDLTLSADQLKRLEKASRFELGYPYDFIRGIQQRW